MSKRLFNIVELGGYPDFTPLYKRAGFEVTTLRTMRKALRQIKQSAPDVVVAEFNFQSDFRDRTSNLESLMAVLQPCPDVKTIIFYEQEYRHQFEKILARFTIDHAFAYPVDAGKLADAVADCARRCESSYG